MQAMRIAGHTCSTPHLGPLEAIDFYGKIGLDGIELSCDENYRCAITHQASPALRQELRSRAQAAGIVFVCLSPFLRDFNVPDPLRRASTIEALCRHIDLAHDLACPSIRVFAGREVEESERREHLGYLVESLRKAGEAAEQAGVHLLLENHECTMSISARQTVEIIELTGHPAIGIIYDQGMLTHHNCEPFADAIPAQAKWIRHVHVKDFIFSLNRRRVATVVGKGQLPWPQIIPALHRHGYGGFLSLEYETRWFQYVGEIPPPEIGLVEGARYLRELLSGLV